MSTHLLSRSLRVAAVCSALALSACGGSSSTVHLEPPPVAGTPAPPVANDSFFAYVLARVNAMLDNDEPESIDGVTETKPDNTEPQPVG